MSLIWCVPVEGCLSQRAAAVVPFDGGWPEGLLWLERRGIEDDPAFQQLIPYVVLHRGGLVWAYRRTGGEARLLDRRSCGAGGHVEKEDDLDLPILTARTAAERELREEFGLSPALAELRPLAWIHEEESAVGRVHLGLVLALELPPGSEPVIGEPDSLGAIGWMQPGEVAADPRFETWSRLAVKALNIPGCASAFSWERGRPRPHSEFNAGGTPALPGQGG